MLSLQEIIDDDDDAMEQRNLIAILISALVPSIDSLPRSRDSSIIQQRMDWKEFQERYECRREYSRHLRMPPEDFEQLLSMVKDTLEVDEKQSLKRGLSPIIPEIKLYCTIRWLAGGSYSDIALFVRVSIASFYRIVWETIDAINSVSDLALHFPRTEEECALAAEEFKSISYGDAIVNCVSAIDGYCPQICTPPKGVVGNVRSYFSGHKKFNCVTMARIVGDWLRMNLKPWL